MEQQHTVVPFLHYVLRVSYHSTQAPSSTGLFVRIQPSGVALHRFLQGHAYAVDAVPTCSHVHTKATWSRGFLPCTPLRVASTAGHSHCVRLLLAAGARVDDLDVKGQTALHVAVVNGWLECVRILLCAGAAPDGSPHHNSSPLHHACREGRDDILSELIRYGAEVDLAFSRSVPACLSSSPLYTSATYRHLSCFQKLLQAGADPNQSGQSHAGTSERSHCLLVDTLRLGCHLPFQQLLVDFGADLTLLPWDELEEHDRQGKAMDASVCYLRQVKANPRTLASLSRLTIRRALGRGRLSRIPCLNLPPPIHLFLLFESA